MSSLRFGLAIAGCAMAARPATSWAQSASPPVPADSLRVPPADSMQIITAPRRVGAAAASLYLGFGLGHVVLGDNRRAARFALTQAGGLLAFGVGLGVGLGYGGRDRNDVPPAAYAAAGVGYVGLVSFAVSRVWDIVDAIIRPIRHNEAVRAARRPPPSRDTAPALPPDSAMTCGPHGGLELESRVPTGTTQTRREAAWRDLATCGVLLL